MIAPVSSDPRAKRLKIVAFLLSFRVFSHAAFCFLDKSCCRCLIQLDRHRLLRDKPYNVFAQAAPVLQ